MKSLLLTLCLMVFVTTASTAQSAKARDMFAAIQGQYELDDNGNVTYVSVIEVPELSFEKIWNRSLNYFTYNYSDGKSVIQVQDKDQGTLTAKGMYNEVHVGMNMVGTVTIDCWHIVRIDVKEGRARVIVTMTDYEVITASSASVDSRFNPVSSEFPIDPTRNYQKTIMTKAFVKAHEEALESLDQIALAIREGNIDSSIDDEWD